MNKPVSSRKKSSFKDRTAGLANAAHISGQEIWLYYLYSLVPIQLCIDNKVGEKISFLLPHDFQEAAILIFFN